MADHKGQPLDIHTIYHGHIIILVYRFAEIFGYKFICPSLLSKNENKNKNIQLIMNNNVSGLKQSMFSFLNFMMQNCATTPQRQRVRQARKGVSAPRRHNAFS